VDELKKQKGFSAVEVILVLVIVALIGVVGYMAYKSHHKAATTTSAKAAAPTKKAATTADPYAGWQSFCSDLGGLCLKYPSTWKFNRITYAQGESATGTEVDTITSASGKVIVGYLPADEGPGGTGSDETINVVSVTPAVSNDFEAISLINIQRGTYYIPESYVNTKSKAYIDQDSGKTPMIPGASVHLTYGPLFTLGGFSNPKKPNDIPKKQILAIIHSAHDIEPPQFSSNADAQAWLSTADVKTAQQILSSVSYKQ
jgi:prepilin-type N-terminal cleavage/methylation domain-containing protein